MVGQKWLFVFAAGCLALAAGACVLLCQEDHEGVQYLIGKSPVHGESISIEEAIEQAPLRLVIPKVIPSDVTLVDTKISRAGDPRYDIVYLIYAKSKPPEGYSVGDVTGSGGMVIIESRHSWPDDYVQQLYKTYGSEVPDASVKTVNGLGIILVGGRRREAVIYAGDRIYDILLSPELGVEELDAVATSIAEQIEVEPSNG